MQFCAVTQGGQDQKLHGRGRPLRAAGRRAGGAHAQHGGRGGRASRTEGRATAPPALLPADEEPLSPEIVLDAVGPDGRQQSAEAQAAAILQYLEERVGGPAGASVSPVE